MSSTRSIAEAGKLALDSAELLAMERRLSQAVTGYRLHKAMRSGRFVLENRLNKVIAAARRLNSLLADPAVRSWVVQTYRFINGPERHPTGVVDPEFVGPEMSPGDRPERIAVEDPHAVGLFIDDVGLLQERVDRWSGNTTMKGESAAANVTSLPSWKGSALEALITALAEVYAGAGKQPTKARSVEPRHSGRSASPAGRGGRPIPTPFAKFVSAALREAKILGPAGREISLETIMRAFKQTEPHGGNEPTGVKQSHRVRVRSATNTPRTHRASARMGPRTAK